MFIGDELESFVEMMRAHFQATGSGEPSDEALVVATDGALDGSSVIGAAYYAPEVMAHGIMNLLFIGVLPEARNRGVGRALVDHFDGAARQRGARLAIIETASGDSFAPAWALYGKAGYDREARIRDYYDDGLDKIIFRKRLSG